MKNKYCSNCGKKLEENSNFCTHCGHKINRVVSNNDAKGNADKQDNSVDVSKNEIASAGKRFLNYIIDYFAINALFFVVLIVCMIVVSIFNSHYVDSAFFTPFVYLVYISTFFLYYYILEKTTGKTLGKLITGTKIIDREGNKPNSAIVFQRTLCRFIPFEAFSYLTSKPYGWHDSIPRVMVVNKVK